MIRSVRLLLALVERSIKGRYRRTYIGIFWGVLQPLFYMVIFTSIRKILNISSGDMPYVIFSFSALVPWTFFSNALTQASTSISTNSMIIKKVSVQREIFPLSGVLVSFVDFLAAFLILMIMVIWYRIPLTWNWLWLFGLVPLLLLLASGLGIAISAFVPYRGDVAMAIPILMQVWMLACPILYPISMVPDEWRFFYTLNPMVGIIEGFRNVIVLGVSPDFPMVGISLLVTVLVWAVGLPVFRYLSRFFAEVY